jgi:hypothetical protein
MASETDPPAARERDEKVSIPLAPEEALRALLATPPPVDEKQPANGKRSKNGARSAKTRK